MNNPRTYWDTFTERYQMGPQKHRIYVLNKLEELGVRSILDVGCGTGPILEMIRQNEERWFFDYKGTDYSPAMIEICQREFPGENFEVEDARKLTEKDGSWDCVLLLHCLDHLNDYEAAIQEAARVAGRYVAIVLWRSFVDGPDNRLNDRNMYGKKEGESPWEDTFLQEYSRERLDKAFIDAKLRIIHVNDGEEVNDPGKYNYVCILDKQGYV